MNAEVSNVQEDCFQHAQTPQESLIDEVNHVNGDLGSLISAQVSRPDVDNLEDIDAIFSLDPLSVAKRDVCSTQINSPLNRELIVWNACRTRLNPNNLAFMHDCYMAHIQDHLQRPSRPNVDKLVNGTIKSSNPGTEGIVELINRFQNFEGPSAPNIEYPSSDGRNLRHSGSCNGRREIETPPMVDESWTEARPTLSSQAGCEMDYLERLTSYSSVDASESSDSFELDSPVQHTGRTTRFLDSLGIFKILEKFPTRFSGFESAAALEFLLELEDFSKDMNLDLNSIVNLLRPLFSDKAACWYSSEKGAKGFTGWKEFSKAFRSRFCDLGTEEELEVELRSRTQHTDEPISDYIQCCKYIARRLKHGMKESKLTKIVVNNLAPKYALALRSHRIRTLQELQELGRKFENTQIRLHSYVPPKPKENMRLPNGGYDPTSARKVSSLDINETSDSC